MATQDHHLNNSDLEWERAEAILTVVDRYGCGKRIDDNGKFITEEVTVK